MRVCCIVSGQAVDVNVTGNTRVGQLRMAALAEAGQPATSSKEWEVRNADGELLVVSNSVSHSDLVEDDKVYISPRAGVGA